MAWRIPLSDGTIQSERDALAYLRAELGERAPQSVRFEREFDESPLDGEGRTALLSFELPAVADAPACGPARCFVAIGQTQANYFPAYDLAVDDAYSFHVGTRFMLELAVRQVDPSLEPPGARESLAELVRRYAGSGPESLELAALFRCEDDYFAVYRLDVAGEPLYAMGADCAPGFYPMTNHPPQAALRLHLGKLIRAESPASDSDGATG